MQTIFFCNFRFTTFLPLISKLHLFGSFLSCFSSRCTISSEVNYTSKYVHAYITTPWSCTYNKELRKQSGLFFHARWTTKCQMQHSPSSGIIFLTLLPSTPPPSFGLFAQMSLFLYTSIKTLHFAIVQQAHFKKREQLLSSWPSEHSGAWMSSRTKTHPESPPRVSPHTKTDDTTESITTLKEPRGQGPDLVMAHHDQ